MTYDVNFCSNKEIYKLKNFNIKKALPIGLTAGTIYSAALFPKTLFSQNNYQRPTDTFTEEIIINENNDLNYTYKNTEVLDSLQVMFKNYRRSGKILLKYLTDTKNINSDNLFDIVSEYYIKNKDFNMFYKMAHTFDISFYDEKLLNSSKDKLYEYSMILSEYAKKNGVKAHSIIQDIDNNYKLNKTESMAIAMDKLSARIFSSKFKNPYIMTVEDFKPNGKFDKYIAQGTSSDCWLLAPIIASKQKLNGNSELIKDLEKRVKLPSNSRQNYTVYINNKNYSVTQSELNLSKEYSSGDLDVRLLEIAVNKYMHANNLGDVFSGNYSKNGFEYLWGNNINVKKVNVNESFFEELKTAKAIVLETKSNIDKNITNTNGKSSQIKPLHAYALSEYDENNIFVIDPYEEHNKYIVSHNDVLQLFKYATIVQ